MTSGAADLIYETSSTPDELQLDEFEEAILGWSRIDPLYPVDPDCRLNRNFPLTWPYRSQGSLDCIKLDLKNQGRGAVEGEASFDGAAAKITYTNPAPYDWWPTTRRNIYSAEFGPLPYSRFLDDTDAYAGMNPPRELGRFIKVFEQPVPREFRRPDFGFVIDGPVVSGRSNEVLQIGFIPFIQADVTYTWFQVPYPDAVPWATIEATYLTVNNANFDGDSLAIGYPAGTLLFSRVNAPDDWYWGPGGRKYVDLQYVFMWNPVGWNNYLKPDGTVVQLKRKNVEPPTPPYPSADFTQLFNPGAG